MDLPTEIIDYILSFLQSDLLSLKTCSQSHPTLSQLVEPYLYANITIVDPDNDSTIRITSENCFGAQELAKILDDHPHIAKHVRHLKINFQDRTLGQKTSPYDCLKTTSLFLPLLSLLRKLTINHTRKYDAYWEIIQKNVSSVLLDQLCLPSMEELHIENVVLNFALLKQCTENIKFLTLRRCALLSSKEAPTQNDLSCPPLLKSMSIENCHVAFLNTSIPWVKVHPLCSLKLNADYSNFPSLVTPILSSCSSSLTILDLDFGYQVASQYRFTMTSVEERYREVFPAVDLSLPCLERLTLRSNLELGTQQVHGGMPPLWTLDVPLPAMLQLIKSSQSLKKLYLDFQYGLWHFPSDTQSGQGPDVGCIWFPLLTIAAASFSLSIDKICVFVRGKLKLRQSNTSLPAPIFSSVVDCQRLMEYVDQGLIVIEGDVSCGDGYEEDSTFASSP